MQELTKTDARRNAFKSIQYDLGQLIEPSDVTDNVEEWSDIDDDVLDRVVWKSIEVMLSERQEPFDSLIRDLAYVLWRDSMPRLSMDKLATDDKRLAVTSMDIWPNSVDKWTALEWLHAAGEPPKDAFDEAREVVERGMYVGLHPLKGVDDL